MACIPGRPFGRRFFECSVSGVDSFYVNCTDGWPVLFNHRLNRRSLRTSRLHRDKYIVHRKIGIQMNPLPDIALQCKIRLMM
jgi:hypothetical protein